MERTLVTKARKWLTPLGYEEVYSTNHPSHTNDEVHLSKEGIRVICVLEGTEEYCRLSYDYLNDYIPATLRTVRFTIGTEMLDAAVENLKKLIAKLKYIGPRVKVYHFDCWGREGIMEGRTEIAANESDATILFKAKNPDMNFDPPY
jgi:hypothetical protein